MTQAAHTLESLGLAGPGRLTLGPAVDPAAPVTGLSVDSRQTKPGHVFAALKGVRLDGAEFIGFAARMGAVAAVATLEGALRAAAEGVAIPVVVDDDPRRRLALLCAQTAPPPPATLVAATGTSGKTSVVSFTRQLWAALGTPAVSLGTMGVEGVRRARLSATTPEPITLHAALAEAAAAGATHAALEASSHGLAQRRLDGLSLAAAAFLNLGRDHMDYHVDAADYAAAKLGLFARVLPEGAAAVVNVDDPHSRWVAQIAAARGQRVIGVGGGADAALRLLEARPTAEGLRLRLAWAGAERAVDLPLIGAFQGVNALAAAGLAIGAGAPAADVLDALPRLSGVRGRMELAATRANGARVYVDYAHKPDALAAALAALRPHCAGRVVVVFGAGGDRDAGKRPLMGEAAARGADLAIVTDDNPRSEDPAAIRRAVMAGCPQAEEVGDRMEAILRGVDALEAADALLIAGKGHETGQIVAGDVTPFDDVEAARAAVAALDGDAA